MSSAPIDRLGSPSITSVSPTDTASPAQHTTEANPATKPAVKPPLERPFSLSLPADNSAAQAVVKNIDASNKETERLTKKSADEDHLKQILEKQKVQDQLLNGPGRNSA